MLQAVAACAAELGVPPAQVALAWLLQNPAVTAPIVGATKIGHVEDALAAAELTLDSDQIARLEEAYRAQPLAAAEPRGGGCDGSGQPRGRGGARPGA